MNQILGGAIQAAEVAPDYKYSYKKRYKFGTLISIFIAVCLFSLCIYAAFDKNKSIEENENKEIIDDTTISQEDNMLVVVFDEDEDTEGIVTIPDVVELNRKTYTSPSGTEYHIDSTLTIPKINLNYPVLSKTTDELLHHNLNKFWGCDPNKIGNYVIAGHNYNNNTYFGRLDELSIGDKLQLTDESGKTLEYVIYNMYYVDPTDVACTSQLTDGKREVTLITCNATGSQRLVVKAREVV